MSRQISYSRRDFLRMAVLATSGTILAACQPKIAETPVEKPVEPPEVEVKTVRMGVWASPEELSFFKDWVAPFQENAKINVNIEYSDWTTYWAKLPTTLSAGTAPDINELGNEILVYGPQNVFMDLNPLFSASGLKMDDFVRSPFLNKSYDGKLLVFPLGLSIEMLAYNKNLFDEAGEPYPDKDWDWMKMVEVATKFTKDKNGNGPNDPSFDLANVTQWGIEMDLGEEAGWSCLVFQNEAEYWLENYTKPNFTDPKVMEAFQFLADMILKYKVAPSPAAQLKFSGSAFQAGQAAMARQGTWMMLPFNTNITSFVYDVTVPPTGKTDGVLADGIGWAMATSSKVQEEAWKLIMFTNIDGQEFMAKKKWQVPILKSAFASFATPPPEHAIDLQEQFDYGHEWATYKNAQQVNDFMYQKTAEIFDGKMTVEQGLQEIQDYVAPLVK